MFVRKIACNFKYMYMYVHSHYLGGECNYDLCKTQRNGDYTKWKWFDLCLYNAIGELAGKERGKFPVFSGVGGLKLDSKVIAEGHFITYTSTSWKKDVATSFMNGKGMMIRIDPDYKDFAGCDVSWISKFPDECEILFSRSTGYPRKNNWKCQVIDESSGIQTVVLKKRW